jgi:hypothetical protein
MAGSAVAMALPARMGHGVIYSLTPRPSC